MVAFGFMYWDAGREPENRRTLDRIKAFPLFTQAYTGVAVPLFWWFGRLNALPGFSAVPRLSLGLLCNFIFIYFSIQHVRMWRTLTSLSDDS